MRAEINWGQRTPPRQRQGQSNSITTKPGTSSQGKVQDHGRQGCPRGHQELNTQPIISQCFWDAGQETVFVVSAQERGILTVLEANSVFSYHLNTDRGVVV